MPVIVRGLAGGIKEVDINPILFNGVFTTFKMYVTYLYVLNGLPWWLRG